MIDARCPITWTVTTSQHDVTHICQRVDAHTGLCRCACGATMRVTPLFPRDDAPDEPSGV